MLVLAFALFGCAQKTDMDAVTARVTALEEKIATLEKRGGSGPTASAADPAKEEAANAIMKGVTEAMKGSDFGAAKTGLEKLTKEFPDTKAGKAGERMYKEVGLIGTDAAPIEVDSWFQGKGDYTGSNVTLMVFWEVWCPHCKKEIPELAAREADLKKKGVQVLAFTKVTKSATDETVAAFLKENKVKFPVAKEKEGSMSKGFNVSGIPAAALVKDGKVIWRGHPGRLDDATLDKLISG
ncbi:hypothetical protein LBMAG42_08920 [Deltaproteobacteria bacterium]|nr:hypothetical protein LBMAG42_08920 [Deltaproteobacteria bacterium]